MSENNPFRSAILLYIGSFVGMGLGSLYWLLISRVTSPDVVGQASAAVTILTISTATAGLGIRSGLPRFLGRAVGDDDFISFRAYIRSSASIVTVSSICVGISLLLANPIFEVFFSFSDVLTTAIVMTSLLASLVPLFRTGLVSLYRTGYVSTITIIGEISRIISGLTMVILGYGVLGVFLGVTLMNIILLIANVIVLERVLKRENEIREQLSTTKSHHGEVVRAGLPSYVPEIIQIIGTQLGTLFVFGIVGASQTGFYYMSMQIYMVVMIAPGTIMTFLFPYISANPNIDALVMSRGIKFALAASFPSVVLLFLYPHVPLSMIGGVYVAASPILQGFALSVLPVSVLLGVNRLVYSRGDYRTVLGIGLLTNIPRLILYYLLTPIYGGMGAVLAFFGGSISGLGAALVASRELQMEFHRATLAKLAIPQLILFVFLYVTCLTWLIGVPLLILVTTVSYARLNVITKKEAIEIAKSILPKKVTGKVESNVLGIIRWLYGE